METMEFNLLREPWVRVRTQDCTVQEVSLTDALLHAHAYVDLAGEMPTQDTAMLRLQLAVLLFPAYAGVILDDLECAYATLYFSPHTRG